MADTSTKRTMYLLEQTAARIARAEADLATARARRDDLIVATVRLHGTSVAQTARTAGVSRQHVYEVLGGIRTGLSVG